MCLKIHVEDCCTPQEIETEQGGNFLLLGDWAGQVSLVCSDLIFLQLYPRLKKNHKVLLSDKPGGKWAVRKKVKGIKIPIFWEVTG